MYGHLSKNGPQSFIRRLYYALFSFVFSHMGKKAAKIHWIDVFLFGCGNWCEILSTGSQIPQSYYLSRLVSGWYCSWRNFSICSYRLQILCNFYHVGSMKKQDDHISECVEEKRADSKNSTVIFVDTVSSWAWQGVLCHTRREDSSCT